MLRVIIIIIIIVVVVVVTVGEFARASSSRAFKRAFIIAKCFYRDV